MPRKSEQQFEHLPFEERTKEQVVEDFGQAKRFMSEFHKSCQDRFNDYHNVRDYIGIRKQNKFPMPIIQSDVDGFVADIRDKLFFMNRPCRLVGRERTDREAADAKQQMMQYQDEPGNDDIHRKAGVWLRDAALYRVCIAQVDWIEKSRRLWRQEPVQAVARDFTGAPMYDENGQPVPLTDGAGNPVNTGETQWVIRKVVTYMAPNSRRVDPLDVYWGSDKREIDDEFPIMVRSFKTEDFFYTKDYFFNQDKLEEQEGTGRETSESEQKKEILDEPIEGATSERPYEYVEWQGQIDKAKLYEWLANQERDVTEIVPGQLYAKNETDDEGNTVQTMVSIEPREKVWSIVGIVNKRVVVRLEENPSELDGPNMIIGFIAAEEEGLLGLSLAEKILAVHKGSCDLMGMLIKSFKLAINRTAVINKRAVVGQSGRVNDDGFVLETNTDVRSVFAHIDPPPIAKDVYTLLEYFKQIGQDAGGRQDILTGKGEGATETLGESMQVMTQAALRMSDYLRSFEDSFIIPLWKMRNHLNGVFITTSYAFRVLGKDGYNWRRIGPDQIRTDVDFVCESSSRENNRSVMIQQILQLSQVAPLALQAGQPVRIDKLAAELCRAGFSWSEEKIRDIWPLLKMEAEQGSEVIDQMLAENALLFQIVQRMQLSMGAGGIPFGGLGGAGNGGQGGRTPGQELTQPLGEQQAATNMGQQMQPETRRFNR